MVARQRSTFGSSNLVNRRTFLFGSLACGLAAGCQSRHQKVLNFYNWSNFIAPDTVKNFEKEFGIRVNYEEFSSADVMYAKLKIGVTGYDLVVAPGYMVTRMKRQDLLLPLDPPLQRERLLPHLQSPPFDPQWEYSAPYLWGTTGIAYNRKKVEGEPDSWDLLWNPKFKRHITMLDEKRDSVSAALFKLGEDPNSTDPKVLEKAKNALLEQRSLVRRYTSDFTDDLIREETWVALGWSGDVAQAQKSNPDIQYYIPDEGGFVFVDNLCIPKSAPHPDNARLFIEYFLRPEVCASISDSTGYANPVTEAKDLVRPDLINNSLGYPPEATLKRLVYQADLGRHEMTWDRLWEEVKR